MNIHETDRAHPRRSRRLRADPCECVVDIAARRVLVFGYRGGLLAFDGEDATVDEVAVVDREVDAGNCCSRANEDGRARGVDKRNAADGETLDRIHAVDPGLVWESARADRRSIGGAVDGESARVEGRCAARRRRHLPSEGRVKRRSASERRAVEVGEAEPVGVAGTLRVEHGITQMELADVARRIARRRKKPRQRVLVRRGLRTRRRAP